MKTILVLGGSGGIGQALFHCENNILRKDSNIFYMSSKDVDVRDYDQVADTINYHKPDYILNLAAISVDGLLKNAPDNKDAQKQISINALGAYNIINAACDYWVVLGKQGKLVMMSSFLSSRPVKGAGIYSATKAFVDNLVKTAAIENAKYGITINSIQAGFFNAGLTDKLPPKIKDSLPSRIPIGRLGKVEELAHAIQFLFENDYVTGTNLVIDGGVSLI